ncbi:hypothetical protein K438DRAFT_2002557 [Mycena galopus ATCC 62051]|nr:hypothetical protein K438DRAFT_2002557 [Mycena galopus ATCC 62051]
MMNFIQMIPANGLPTQYWSNGASLPLATATQPTTLPATLPATQPATTQHTHETSDVLFFLPGSQAARSGLQVPACADVPVPDACFPDCPTCPMPHHTDVGVNREEHSGNTGCKFYVVCPGRVQGTYNTFHCLTSLTSYFTAFVPTNKSRGFVTDAPSPSTAGWTLRLNGLRAASAGTVRLAPMSVLA